MKYVFKTGAFKRLIFFIVLLALILLIGIYLLFSVMVPVGILIIVGTSYLGYLSIRMLKKQLASSILVNDVGMMIDFFGEDEVEFPWEKLTIAGIGEYENGAKSLFVYREDSDKFVEVPDNIYDFENLVGEIAGKKELVKISLARGETLKNRIKEFI